MRKLRLRAGGDPNGYDAPCRPSGGEQPTGPGRASSGAFELFAWSLRVPKLARKTQELRQTEGSPTQEESSSTALRS